MQSRFSALAFAVLVIVVPACVADDTTVTTAPTSEPSVTEPSTTTTTGDSSTSTTTSSSTTTTTTSPPPSVPGGELVRCESPEGYSIDYPATWSTNSGEVVPECGQFHPDTFEVPVSDERVAAITVFIDPVRFADVVTPVEETELERATTAVDGLQAVRLEYETDSDGFWPEGTPITTYAIDVSIDGEPATMFVDTIGLSSFDYETNQVVLDRMVRSIDIDMEGVDDDADVVARYLGGGGGFSVVAEATDSEACLRIPPNGEPICTALPSEDQLHTIQLTDLEPVLAGITGSDVFAVTGHLRDGGTSTVLPVPIDDRGVGGFSFTSGLDAFESFTLTDITGGEVRTVTPGG